MQNAGHHIVHTEALDDLRRLLTRAAWLECKLHSYGVGSVVADFRSPPPNLPAAHTHHLATKLPLHVVIGIVDMVMGISTNA